MSVTFVQLTRHYYRAMQEISFRNDILPLKDKLYRLALRITLNSAEAEDVVQDTMIRVWNKRDEWPQFESIEAYCLTIARNLAIDRSQKMEAQNLQLTSEVREMPDTLTPYDRLAQNEQMQLVHRLVNELPERQRTIMQLRDVEGKSYKEIADILQITEEQVKWMENAIDDTEDGLPGWKGFVIPGGTRGAAVCHVCRTVCRRTERRILDLAGNVALDAHLLAYINRLSDYLFVLARKMVFQEGKEEILWRKC